MKKQKLMVVISLICILSLFIGSFIICQAQESKTFIMGIDPEYPPFTYIKDGEPVGFDVDCIKWIAKEMGFKLNIMPMAWDSLIPSLKAKKIDFIASGMAVTEERLKQVDFSEPYHVNEMLAITREDADFNIITALSLGHSVGILRGSTENTWVEKNLVEKGVNLKLKLYDSGMLVIEDLVNGRADVAIIAYPSIKEALKQGKPIKILGQYGQEGMKQAYAVRKGDTELLNILNEGLSRLKKTAEWAEWNTVFE